MTVDFSILISTYNRAASLPQLVDALSRQETGAFRGELIIVDNASQDDTFDVLSSAECSIPLTALQEPQPGKNKALNRALQHAQGSLLIFTDDDVVPCVDWVGSLVQAAHDLPEAHVFCGPIDLMWPEGTAPWIQQLPESKLLPLYCQFRPTQNDDIGPIDTLPFGANLAIRKPIFDSLQYNEQVGPQGTNYAMGSETDLLLRLQEQGHQFYFVPKAQLGHVVRPDQVELPWMLRRAYNYGRGRARRTTPPPRHTLARRWQLASLGMKSMLSQFRGPAQQFAAGWAYHQLRGFLAETS